MRQNIYQDEQEKIDSELKKELELNFKMADLLGRYGYKMEAVLEDGLPVIRFTKN